MVNKISDILPLLQRFPQCAYLQIIGDRGIDDLRVMAPMNGSEDCIDWREFHIDAEKLPWLNSEAT